MQEALLDQREEEVLERLKRREGLNERYNMGELHPSSDGGNTILHVAIRYKVSVRIVRAIFEAGFTGIDRVNGKYAHAVEYILSSQPDVMDCCLQNGLNPNVKLWSTRTPNCTLMFRTIQTFIGQYPHDNGDPLFRDVKLLLRYGGDPYVFRHRIVPDPLARYLKSIRPLVHMCVIIKRGGGDGLVVELIRHLATFLR